MCNTHTVVKEEENEFPLNEKVKLTFKESLDLVLNILYSQGHDLPIPMSLFWQEKSNEKYLLEQNSKMFHC